MIQVIFCTKDNLEELKKYRVMVLNQFVKPEEIEEYKDSDYSHMDFDAADLLVDGSLPEINVHTIKHADIDLFNKNSEGGYYYFDLVNNLLITRVNSVMQIIIDIDTNESRVGFGIADLPDDDKDKMDFISKVIEFRKVYDKYYKKFGDNESSAFIEQLLKGLH